MNKLYRCTVGLSLLISSSTAVRAAPEYTIARLGTLGGETADAVAINNKGQVAGSSDTTQKGADGNPIRHAYLYADGKMVDLGVPTGYESSESTSLNGQGEVVGKAAGSNGKRCAFLYRNGKTIDLNTLLKPDAGWQLQVAAGINDAGQVIGQGEYHGKKRSFLLNNQQITELSIPAGYDSSNVATLNNRGDVTGALRRKDGKIEACRWHDGKAILLGSISGFSESLAGSINDAGDIVGSVKKGHDALPFLYHNGRMTKMSGEKVAAPLAMNATGSIVGIVPGFPLKAFLYRGGVYQDLNTLIPREASWDLSLASGINDQGQIVGFGQYKDKDEQAFLMTPIQKK